MINTQEKPTIPSPIDLISRLINQESSFEVTLFDKFGNNFTGRLEELSEKSNTVLISDKDKNKTIFDLNYATHVTIKDQNSTVNLFKNLETKQPTSEIIDIDEIINLTSEMFKSSYDLEFKFFADKYNNNVEAEKVSIVIDYLTENIKKLTNDDFTLSAINKVHTFHIKNDEMSKFNLKLNNKTITIKINYSEPLPHNINQLIEKGLNRTL